MCGQPNNIHTLYEWEWHLAEKSFFIALCERWRVFLFVYMFCGHKQQSDGTVWQGEGHPVPLTHAIARDVLLWDTGSESSTQTPE